MYRPTVRYSDVFKTYVDDVYRATSLDRNQIIRLALFAAPTNKLFITQLERFKKPDVPLPSSLWEVWEHGFWQEQNYTKKEEGRDVNAIDERTGANETTVTIIESGRSEVYQPGRQSKETRRQGQISSRSTRDVKTSAGGIKLVLG